VVDSRGRIYVRKVGLCDGERVVFIEHMGNVFISRDYNIIGKGTVNDGRLFLSKKVREKLNLNPGDTFAIIKEKEINSTHSANLRLAKVVGIREE